MAKLSPIYFIIGLPANFNVNGGQNKFKVDVSKHVAKIANIWPTIGQLPLWRATFGNFSSDFDVFVVVKLPVFRDKSNGAKNKALSLLV